MFPDNPIFIPKKLIMQEYRPFDRIEVYREIVETIKKDTFCQQRLIYLFPLLKIGSGKRRKVPNLFCIDN